MSDNSGGTITLGKDALYGIVILVLAMLLVVSVFTQGFGFFKPAPAEGNQTAPVKLSDAVLKSKVENYINANLLAPGYTAEVTKLEPYDRSTTMASINIKQGATVLQSASAYVSNDGSSIFIGQAFKLNETTGASSGASTSQTQSGGAKVAKPKAEVFVMSFCPYGLQFMKAFVPVMELLGDKADMSINFVDYAMHGKKEIDANSYIYCVQKEDKPKLSAYLRCFVEDGDYSGCVSTAGLDSTKISSCVTQLDAQYNLTAMFNDQSTWAGGSYPQYPVESALNAQYGVQGSPTFILNGEEVSINSRSAESIKAAICATFTDQPAECNTTLRTSQESPGLGPVGSGTTSGGSASCG